MIFLFYFLISGVLALSEERKGLCQFTESIPALKIFGWKNCTEITNTTNLSLFDGLYFLNGKVVGMLLRGWQITGSIPDVFDKLPNIYSMSIESTELTGTLPSSISILPLQGIKINNNTKLTGTLPGFSPSLSSLEVLNTPLTGSLPDLSLCNKLYKIIIANTKITGTMQNLVNLVSLQNILIANNLISGTLPKDLPPNLSEINFSYNRFSGTISDVYFTHLKLRTLNLGYNKLSGTIQLITNACTTIFLSNNQLSGTLPDKLGQNGMWSFDISHNEISGIIPSKIFTHISLADINLSNNRIEGTIPDDINVINTISSVNFSNNQLTGTISRKIFQLDQLRNLFLQNNRLNGTLQGSIKPLERKNYHQVSLANNSLSGSIPQDFFSQARFISLDISGNLFSGCGPIEPIINTACNFGNSYYSGCTPVYSKCKHIVKNDCQKFSGYFGLTCKKCNCTSGLVCDDGIYGDGTCEGFNPCKRNNCEGICNINGNDFVCSCGFPGIINTTDMRSCNCPFGFTKEKEGSCVACKPIDNCLQITTCDRCLVCQSGYEVTSNGQCLLNKNCLFSEWTSWSKCEDCSGGVTLRYRNLSGKNTALPFYCQEFLYNRSTCGFPCVETTITSKDAILDYLYRSYTQWNWLSNELNLSSVNISKTRDYIFIVPMENTTWLEKTVNEILPLINSTRYIISLQDEGAMIEVLEEKEVNITGIAVGVSVGILVLLSILLLFIIKRKQSKWLFDLPHELQFYFNPKGNDWVSEGNCKMREISHKDEMFQQIWSKCSTNAISIDHVYIVSNPILGASFSNYRSILRQRIVENPILFCKKDWILKSNGIELRTYVHERFLQLTNYFSWNDPQETVPIIACLHATDFNTAKSISSKGYCALATLDEGFYGKGIYFSSYGSYVAPYFIGKENPSILVNLVICGNAFPVIEAAIDKDNFLGKPTVSGYQSHFVCTKSDGSPIKNMHSDDESNEIVVSQEAQVVPIYIVRISSGHKLEEFTRSSSTLFTPLLIDESEIV